MSIKVKEEFVNFSKTYGKGKKQVKACSNINLSFESGSVTGLLGPNGAGKTTILKALCGYHYPTEGEVRLTFGEHYTGDFTEIRQNTGLVPETPMLDFNLTVKETLYFSAISHNLQKKEALDNIEKAVEYCSLQEVLYKKTGTLSKGFMQRTNFAKSLSYNPKVLILDEFSGGLDPLQIANMKTLILTLAKEKAVILSTHHIEEADSLCKNVYIISHGDIVSSGTADQIVAKTNAKNLEEAFLSLVDENESASAALGKNKESLK